MQFYLVDRIVACEPGRSLKAVKLLTLGEEYLVDHFPSFPVMPGVLMLQALVEAGSWLLRATDDFAHSITVLREVRNVKYGSFLAPGSRLDMTVEIASREGDRASIKGRGENAGVPMLNAQFTLESYSLVSRNPGWQARDGALIAQLRERFSWLYLG